MFYFWQPVPDGFWRMFWPQLSLIVKMYLRNDVVYSGTYSKIERIMNGINGIIVAYGLSECLKLLFTYFGEGNFFVMIFESSDVENLLLKGRDLGTFLFLLMFTY